MLLTGDDSILAENMTVLQDINTDNIDRFLYSKSEETFKIGDIGHSRPFVLCRKTESSFDLLSQTIGFL